MYELLSFLICIVPHLTNHSSNHGLRKLNPQLFGQGLTKNMLFAITYKYICETESLNLVIACTYLLDLACAYLLEVACTYLLGLEASV